MLNILKHFFGIAVPRGKSRVVPLNALPKDRSLPFENVVLETLPVITVDVIRPISTMLVNAWNRFIFFWQSFIKFSFIKQMCLNLINFLTDTLVTLLEH